MSIKVTFRDGTTKVVDADRMHVTEGNSVVLSKYQGPREGTVVVRIFGPETQWTDVGFYD